MTAIWMIQNYSVASSSPVILPSIINMNRSELWLPANSLTEGTYQFILTINLDMQTYNMTASASTYIQMSPSKIIVNLLPFGPSSISHGFADTLTLDPGTFSINPDFSTFDVDVGISCP
jgi:hypothetical protein